jgi:hypothetical protein
MLGRELAQRAECEGWPLTRPPVTAPAAGTSMKPGRREAILIVIAKARKWMDDLAQGRAANH